VIISVTGFFELKSEGKEEENESREKGEENDRAEDFDKVGAVHRIKR
jgi:hypothetical protein